MKKSYLFSILAAVLVVSGCTSVQPSGSAKTNSPAIVTPDMSLAAKVVDVDEVARFVVMSFPEDKMPKLQTTLFIYRAGLKVAEVKVTGPQQEHNIVADLVTGTPKLGDTVRSE